MKRKENSNTRQELNFFEVWKEYEHIAMHFNELLIQLRIRALGGIAVIVALVSILSKGDASVGFRWGIVAAVFIVLTLVWVAIWIIDMNYYRRLLFGAVRAVLEIEKESATRKLTTLMLSHRIKEAVEGNFSGLDKNPLSKDAAVWFYTLVFLALLVGFGISFWQYIYP